MGKKVFVTGITGQDGSYLAELLLEKGYGVYGLVRRCSTTNLSRIQHLLDRIGIIYGDLTDSASLDHAIRDIQPDYIYNLGAQSFVGESWRQPINTHNVIAGGTLNLLESMRKFAPGARFYQASSSEMFGASPGPQNEDTPFYPRSPYGVAKLAANWYAQNYRESHGLFVSQGVLFNHECLSGRTPLLVRKENGIIDVVAIEELAPVIVAGKSVQTFDNINLSVWDGNSWTPIEAITGTRRRVEDVDHQMIFVDCYGGAIEVTSHHHMLDKDHQILRASQVEKGQFLAIAESLPEGQNWTVVTPEMAELLGLLTADGWVEKNGTTISFTKNDKNLRLLVEDLWLRVFGESSKHTVGMSGFNPEKKVGKLMLHSSRGINAWVREQIYTPSGDKKIPLIILNSSKEIQEKYLQGYYAGDGLKTQEWDSVVTNSEVLALGLVYLYSLQGRRCCISIQSSQEWYYYRINLGTLNAGENRLGRRMPLSQARDPKVSRAENDWVYDIETKNGKLMAGIGKLIVHNSPRRGYEFVTRKISRGVAEIAQGKRDKLLLGNLDAKRDWGHASDYMRAAILIMEHKKPDIFVVGTGTAWSVREFVQCAFEYVNLNWEKYVEIDPQFLRPAEVNHLLADVSKIKRELNWQPTISFPQLVKEMVEYDLQNPRNEIVV